MSVCMCHTYIHSYTRELDDAALELLIGGLAVGANTDLPSLRGGYKPKKDPKGSISDCESIQCMHVRMCMYVCMCVCIGTNTDLPSLRGGYRRIKDPKGSIQTVSQFNVCSYICMYMCVCVVVCVCVYVCVCVCGC